MHPAITPRELATMLTGPEPLTVVDVRWSLTGPSGRVDYRAGHLPGAVFLDVDTDLAGPPGPGGRHPLPYPVALQASLRAAGVRATAPVVAYDAADGSVAARLWWLLRWAGHPAVAVLDGGIAAWRAAGLPVTMDVPEPQGGTITVRPQYEILSMWNGNQRGSSMISTGMTGTLRHGMMPNSESRMRVKTFACAAPPRARMASRARRMCSESTGSPIIFRAK